MTMSSEPVSGQTTQDKAEAATHQRENLAHRLRSPLHTILGYAGLLKADASARQLEQLGIIEDSARALLASIDALPDSVKSLPWQGLAPASAHGESASAPSTFTLRRLPGNELAMLRSLLDFGRLIAIERWAQQLGERVPDLLETTRHIQMLARSANLPELQQLLRQSQD